MFGPELIPVIKSIGYLGIFLSVVLESGVILFFFMPSDSLLFAAGFLASQNILDIKLVIPVCFVGAVIGYMIGYFLGQKAEPKLRSGKISKYIDTKQLEEAEVMYRKYANVALLLARFFPIRAFVSFFAGAAAVPYRTFMFYDIVGAALWSVSLTLLGYFFGEFFTPDDLDTVFIFIFLVFIFGLAAMMIFVHSRASQSRKKAIMDSEKK
jgi:membrane-associated protein